MAYLSEKDKLYFKELNHQHDTSLGLYKSVRVGHHNCIHHLGVDRGLVPAGEELPLIYLPCNLLRPHTMPGSG